MAELLRVVPSAFAKILPRIEPLLVPALDIGDQTLEGCQRALMTGQAQLWIAVSPPNDILAAAITELIEVPKYKICAVICAGGDRMNLWKHFMDDFERFARSEGCALLRISGRPGWRRIFPDWEEPFITLEKRL